MRGKEYNFVEAVYSPIVFTDVDEINDELIFSVNIRLKFNPYQLKISQNSKFYHPISIPFNRQYPSPYPDFWSNKNRQITPSKEILGLLEKNLSLQLLNNYVTEMKDEHINFVWKGEEYKIPFIDKKEEKIDSDLDPFHVHRNVKWWNVDQ